MLLPPHPRLDSLQRAQDELAASPEWLRHALDTLLFDPPVATRPSGLRASQHNFKHRLRTIGFDVVTVTANTAAPVLVATRPRGPTWIGISGHYDIEAAGTGWTTDPFRTTITNDRIYARGVADNLGPLLLRLEAVARIDAGPSIVILLQGEEEIGSPTAHVIYPTLELPGVALWVEETGYFERDGTQRLLARRIDSRTERALHAVEAVAHTHGRRVERHDRYLNKAFGTHRCPFLTHLVGEAPYVAFGPNDPDSCIHAANESLPLANLDISIAQTLALLNAFGGGS